MENCGNLRGLQEGARRFPREACSACAGDYEDPDRTAWDTDVNEDEEAEDQASEEQLPEPEG